MKKRQLNSFTKVLQDINEQIVGINSKVDDLTVFMSDHPNLNTDIGVDVDQNDIAKQIIQLFSHNYKKLLPVLDAPELSLDEPELSLDAPELSLEAPVLDAPVLSLEAPVLDAPVLDAPELSLEAPVLDAPVLDAPVLSLEAPVVEAPELSLDAPKLDDPELSLEAPVLDTPELSIEAPVLDAPVLDAPVIDAPVLDTPELSLDAPVLDAPELSIEAPVLDAPELSLDAPVLEAPVLDTPELSLDAPVLDAPELSIEAPVLDTPELSLDAPVLDAPVLDAPELSLDVLQSLDSAAVDDSYNDELLRISNHTLSAIIEISSLLNGLDFTYPVQNPSPLLDDVGSSDIEETLNENQTDNEETLNDIDRENDLTDDKLIRLTEEQNDILTDISNNSRSDDNIRPASDNKSGFNLGSLFGMPIRGLAGAGKLLLRIGGPLAAVGAFLSFAKGFGNAESIVGKDTVSTLERVGAGGASLLTDALNILGSVANWFLPEKWKFDKLDPQTVYKKGLEILGPILNFGSTVIDWLDTNVRQTIQNALGFVLDTFETSDSITGALGTIVRAWYGFLLNGFVSLVTDIGDAIVDTDLVQGAIEKWNQFGQWVDEEVLSIPEKITNALTGWFDGIGDFLSQFSPSNLIKMVKSKLPSWLGGDDVEENSESTEDTTSPSLMRRASSFIPWLGGDDVEAVKENDDAVLDTITGDVTPVNTKPVQIPDATTGSRAELSAMYNTERSSNGGARRETQTPVQPTSVPVQQPSTVNNNTQVNNMVSKTVTRTIISGGNRRSYSRTTYTQRRPV